VLRHDADLTACGAGDILVMRHANPAVAVAARQAVGFVCETGGLLNHLAILARELGTPCVTGVPGIVDALESGVELTIDGSRGTVDALSRMAALTPPTIAGGELVPVLQFGRFSATFECEESSLIPEAAVRAASLAVLPEVLGLGDALTCAFDGNRILVPRQRLRDLSRGAADLLEAAPTSAVRMRASYDEASRWPGWHDAGSDPPGAVVRFVLLNCWTWVAALAKEELATRLRAAIGAHVLDRDVADEVLLASLTTRGVSYLLGGSPAAAAGPAALPADVSADASSDIGSRSEVLRHLVWLTEHKNTVLARLSVLMARLPVASALGLGETDLVDDGTAGGRAAMVRRVLEVMPRPVMPR
jgi:phosphohistidine swiveling domain-containing protein